MFYKSAPGFARGWINLKLGRDISLGFSEGKTNEPDRGGIFKYSKMYPMSAT